MYRNEPVNVSNREVFLKIEGTIVLSVRGLTITIRSLCKSMKIQLKICIKACLAIRIDHSPGTGNSIAIYLHCNGNKIVGGKMLYIKSFSLQYRFNMKKN